MKPESPLSQKLFLLDLTLSAVAFYLATLVRRELPYGEALSPASAHPPLMLYGMVVASWATALIVQGVYEPDRVVRWYQETIRVVIASLMATVLLAGAIYLTNIELSRFQFGYALVTNLFLLLGVRYVARIWARVVGLHGLRSSVRILVVGAGDLGERAAKVLARYRRWGYEVIGFLDDDREKAGRTLVGVPNLGPIDEIENVVMAHEIGDVWIALPVDAHDTVHGIVERLATLPVRVHIVPDFFPLALVSAKPRDFSGLPVIALRDPVIAGLPRHVKRVFDIIVSLTVLALTAPMLAVLAILIRLDSPGRVIFRQDRVGENGRIFEMFKFRTMVDAPAVRTQQFEGETDLAAITHKRRADPRVTGIGHFLRRYSLDELPQLYNTLRGDMSLVGPRPELPWVVAKYDPWQRRRLAVPQGMTGWWQVTGRSDKPMHLHTDEDLYYVYHYSLWLDVQILVKTVKVVVQGEGAF